MEEIIYTDEELYEFLSTISSLDSKVLKLAEIIEDHIGNNNGDRIVDIYWHFVGCHGWRFCLKHNGIFLAKHEDTLNHYNKSPYVFKCVFYPGNTPFQVSFKFTENHEYETKIQKIIKWIMEHKELAYTFALNPSWFNRRTTDEIPSFMFDYKMDVTINNYNFTQWNAIVKSIGGLYALNSVNKDYISKQFYKNIMNNKRKIQKLTNKYYDIWRKDLPTQLVKYTKGDIQAAMIMDNKVYLYTYTEYFKDRIKYFKENYTRVPQSFWCFLADNKNIFTSEEIIETIWENILEKANLVLDYIQDIKKYNTRIINPVPYYDPTNNCIEVKPISHLYSNIEFNIEKGNRFWLAAKVDDRDFEYYCHDMSKMDDLLGLLKYLSILALKDLNK